MMSVSRVGTARGLVMGGIVGSLPALRSALPLNKIVETVAAYPGMRATTVATGRVVVAASR